MINTEGKCSTCTHEPSSPYRRRNAEGTITEGCIDEAHNGLLTGDDLEWHDRLIALEWRAKQVRR